MQHMSLDMFLKEATFCHTATLPAEIRYKGLLTDTPDKIGDALLQNYSQGVFQSTIEAVENPAPTSGVKAKRFVDAAQPDTMIIVKQDGEYQTCPELLHVDFQDSFLSTSLESWRYVRFPTEAQKTHYTEFDMQQSKGWIFVCMAKCKSLCQVVSPVSLFSVALSAAVLVVVAMRL
jgi:hypothetical protein